MSRDESEATEMEAASSGTSEMSVLQDALQEIRAMREERLRLQEELEVQRQNNTGQSLPISLITGQIKADIFDGTVSLREYLCQLELRLGQQGLFQNFYTQFINRKQRFGEEIMSYGLEIERLARLAYPENEREMRIKIACAQFIVGLASENTKRLLQLEGVVSLEEAIERAKTIETIYDNGSEKRNVERKEFFGEERIAGK
ncbi:hypothetical protein EAI_09797 [Harpegnathos saltator]|uniref:Retrotransposon gag domain-containing protein n=1 Tax=Harpegnathos saltator TaxID=610380 RepID=E2BPP5_HARSA|nr:hypothetical protein EAI_09797 [Harpegnathos saltator]